MESVLQTSPGKRVAVTSKLFGSLHVVFGGLTGLLLGSQGVDLLTCSHETAIILLLDLGADIVEGDEGRGSVDIVFELWHFVSQPSMSAGGE